MLIAQLLAAVERLAPPELAEDWDNVGLIVGRHNRPARRLLVALELRSEVIGEAREHDCEAILTHHPPIFPAVVAVTDSAPAAELVLRAAESKIAVLAAHTNLDAAAGGLNDLMAGVLGLSDCAPLAPHLADPACGLGRIGRLEPTTLGEVVRRAAAGFGASPVAYAGDLLARVERVACCTGSGASLIPAARAAEADAYVTSDLKHHDADRAEGLPLVALPHAQVERATMRRWAKGLARLLAAEGVEVRFAEAETDLWQTA